MEIAEIGILHRGIYSGVEISPTDLSAKHHHERLHFFASLSPKFAVAIAGKRWETVGEVAGERREAIFELCQKNETSSSFDSWPSYSLSLFNCSLSSLLLYR